MTVDLTSYDYVLINTSAGKDSLAMLDWLVERCDAAGVERSRIVAVHADLGRVEWEGTRELAERQVRRYDATGGPIRFEVVRRPQGDLLDQIVQRRVTLDAEAAAYVAEADCLVPAVDVSLDAAQRQRAEHDRLLDQAARKRNTPAWPSSTARYCTSDQKTSQVKKLLTRLVAELALDRPVRILNCLGIRAAESPARAKKSALSLDSASNSKREVTRWLPIHDWTDAQVWDRLRSRELEVHPAYAAGMPRLSCCFCVLSSKPALVRAAQLNPELAQEYLAVEQTVGHTFRQDLSIAEIVEEAARTPVGCGAVASWSA
jgi:3'-phosphoadenosine 5'-phosphosulfate sulfotransferase (PAPS reductase)/FAD synthetase